MLTPEQIDRMCSSKKRLEQLDAERKAFWRGMRAYHCPVCDGWHLTTLDAPLYPERRSKPTAR